MTRFVAAIALLLACLAAPRVSPAAVLDASVVTQGTLTSTPVTTVAVGPDSLHVGRNKFRSLVVTIWNTAGTATVELDINCTPTVATGWGQVSGSSSSFTVSTAVQSLIYPACDYRINTTACTGCSVNANFFLGPDMQ